MMEFWQEGQLVATAPKTTAVFFLKRDKELEDIKRLDLWYFSSVHMEPCMAFEHLAGTALSRFFDNCTLIVDAKQIGPLRYVHGRSEVMKGKHAVTSVLLCMPVFDQEISNSVWLSYLPKIYKKALAGLDTLSKAREPDIK